jgi:hypothetical protein
VVVLETEHEVADFGCNRRPAVLDAAGAELRKSLTGLDPDTTNAP